MKISSAKQKGRKACQEAKALILGVLGLSDDEIHVTSSSAPGKDLWLSPNARSLFPFVVECKNVERLNVREAYAQAEEHWKKELSREDVYPIVIHRQNHAELLVTLSLEDFLHFSYQRGKNVLQKEDPALAGIHLP